MTVKDAEAASRVAFKENEDIPSGYDECVYVQRADGKGSDVSYMVLDGKIARIDVLTAKIKPAIVTDHGIGIGSTEADIRKAYGDRVSVVENVYDDENDEVIPLLRVLSDDEANGILFVIEKGHVRSFWAGTAEAILYQEGCL